MLRWIAAALLIAVAALGYVAWKRYAAPPPQASTPESSGMPPGGGAQQEVAGPSEPGIHWTVPAAWTTGPERQMRLATYVIGDAECAVFYFGPNQGGAVDENIDRWAGQFEGAPNPKRESRTVQGMKVTRVEIDGAYLSPGADMQSQGTKPGWRMLGAIVQGPQGPVFFKFTGPAGTVSRATKDFDALLASVTAH